MGFSLTEVNDRIMKVVEQDQTAHDVQADLGLHSP